MKIVAFNGSRRKQGNTNLLLQKILEAPEQTAGAMTEIVDLGDYDISACSGCEGCRRSWDCVIKDDFSGLVGKMDQADAIIFASPTYWYTVTSDMKRFVDRCYSLIQFPNSRREWISKYRNSRKLCVTAAVCEQHEESMMGNTLDLLSDFSRDVGLELVASVAALGCFEAGSLAKDDGVLDKAKLAGEKLTALLRDGFR